MYIQISKFSEKVTEWLESFFSSFQDHTGCKPPVNLQADKGTKVHWRRQFIFVVTVAQESPSLLIYIYLGQPTVNSDDGSGVSQSIIDEFSS